MKKLISGQDRYGIEEFSRQLISYRLLYLVIQFFLFLPGVAKSQQEVNIDASHGLMTVNIPIYQFALPDFNVDVGFSYSGRGYRVLDGVKDFVGWNFVGTGTVTRVLRDLPDEKVSSANDNRLGWAAQIWRRPLDFNVLDDNNESVCDDEAINYNNVFTYFPTYIDAQPDIFVVDAPGLYCQLMIDNEGTLREVTSPQGLRIEWLSNSSNDKYFIITNTKGIRYTFDKYNKVRRSKTTTSYNVDLFKRSNDLFSTALSYPSTWYLTEMKSISYDAAERMTFEYDIMEPIYESDSREVWIKDNAADTARAVDAVKTNVNTTGNLQLTKIVNSMGAAVTLQRLGKAIQSISIYKDTTTQHYGDKVISFSSKWHSDKYQGKNEYWLTKISEYVDGCSKTKYKFKYYGIAEGEETSDQDIPIERIQRTDAWGYPNGNLGTKQYREIYVYPDLEGTASIFRHYPLPGYTATSYHLPGLEGAVNPNKVMLGTMSMITYPNGGSSTFEYESNSFNDPAAASDVMGGGLRIKAINTFDGINPSIVNKKEYSYLNDIGKTSGIMNRLPVFTIRTPYYNDPIAGVTKSYNTIVSSYGANSAAYWNHLTVRTTEDFSGGSEVSYSHVTIKETGNGKTKLTFATPRSFAELTHVPVTYPSAPCDGSNSNFVTKGYYKYPFAHIDRLDGQNEPLSESLYNESGHLLKKIEYAYEDYSNSPLRIYGLAFDQNYGIRQFTKYYHEIYKKLTSQIKETVYDSNLTGNSFVTQTDFENTAYNREVRSKTVVNSDGSRTRTKYLYSGDFSEYPLTDFGTSQEAIGLYRLNEQNLKKSILEEITSYAAPGTNTFLTTGAKLNLFRQNASGTNRAVNFQTKLFSNLNGVSDFSSANISGSGTNKTLSWDSRYQLFGNYSNHGNLDVPSLIVEKGQPKSYIYDTRIKLPVLTVNGANLANFCFSNFEQIGANSAFAIENFALSKQTTDHYSGKAYILAVGDGINKTVVSSSGNKLYKIAFLAKANIATSASILINGAIVANIPITASTEWKYYEREVDGSGTKTIRLMANGQFTIDNVIYYPSSAGFTAVDYEYPAGQSMTMSESGLVRKYDYDGQGRMTCLRDVDNNILETKLYNQASTIDAPGTYSEALSTHLSIRNSQWIFPGDTVKFEASKNCTPDVKYTWDFGDGSPLFVTYNTDVTHVFNTAGTYPVSVTVAHPNMVSFTDTENLTIKQPAPITATLSLKGLVRKNTLYNIRWLQQSPGVPINAPNMTFNSTFSVVADGCPGSTYYYYWEKSSDGVNFDTFWPMYPTDSSEIIIPETYWPAFIPGPDSVKCWVRCRVVSSYCGSVAITNSFVLEFGENVF